MKVIRSGERDVNGNLPPEVWAERAIAATLNLNDLGSESRAVDLVVADTLRSHPRPGSNSVGAVVVTATGDTTHTLTSEGADASEDGTGRGTPVIAFAWQSGGDRSAADAMSEEMSPTLPKSQTMAVSIPGVTYADAQEANAREVLLSLRETLGAEGVREWSAGISPALQPPTVLRQGVHAGGVPGETEDLFWQLVDHAQAGEIVETGWAVRGLRSVKSIGRSPRRRELAEQRAGELEAALSQLPYQRALQTTVRRLTPLETERLQGFPDGWTLTSNGKPQADSARYRQMGNSVAVPCIEWIVRRIVSLEDAAPRTSEGRL